MRRSAALCCVGLALLIGGCGGSDGSDEPAASASGPVIQDPGPIHVHGLGINPKDGALFVATHTGLFRVGADERKGRRVADRFQDTMGFTVVGPDRFLGSGHPDGRERLPPFLGLIKSTDAAKKWEPVSLLGERDFHVLEAAGRRVYGYGYDFKSRQPGLLASDDGGKSWSKRAPPEPLLSLAIAPDDPEQLVASGERGVFVSPDAGRGWRPTDAPAGLLAWTAAGVTVVTPTGKVYSGNDPAREMNEIGTVGGAPAALDSGPDGDLYAALHDGTIKRSANGGKSWSVRSTPGNDTDRR